MRLQGRLLREKEGWPETISNFRDEIKGSAKDPLFYLGITSAILFAALSFSSSSLFSKGNFSFLANNREILAQNFQSDPFMGLKKSNVKESPDLFFVQSESLKAISSPILVTPQVLGVLTGDSTDDTGISRREIIEYIVEPKDTLKSVAEKFNISLSTLLWANNLSRNSSLRTNQSLIILPVSGVLHYVQKGDTLDNLAKKYKTETSEILSFNELAVSEEMQPGDILVIPDGIMPQQKSLALPQTPLADSYFILPTQGRITQGLHWYNAVDLANRCGTPVYAAAQGDVQKAKTGGWNSGAGNYITLKHPNGVITFYGHLLKVLVNPGEQVSQGQMIALMGGEPGTPGAGKSTGCHLHFEVRGAKNPFGQ